jgi:hypothetical protein
MEVGSLASQNHSVALDVFQNYVHPHLRLQLGSATASAYRLADPTSTLCDTHLFVVDYNVNPQLQHYHQQVQFAKAVLWTKDEWIAREMKWRNPSGDSQYENVFRSQFTMDVLDPVTRQRLLLSVEGGVKNITIVVNLIFRDRNQNLKSFFFPLPLLAPFRTTNASPRILQFDNFNTLLDGVRIPPGLPLVGTESGEMFTAIYCHPELSEYSSFPARLPVNCLLFACQTS